MLEDAAVACTLYFAGQATFTVKVLEVGLLVERGGNPTVQRIVAVAAQFS
jgi:hypothetical protein